MTESERIDFLINVMEGGNGSQFGERIGTDRATVCDLRSGRRRIRRYVDRIIAAYPAVSRTWLTTGEGHPGDITIDIVKARLEETIRRQEQIIDHLISRINELQRDAD